jgi:SAM-dependent methyltransferase
LPRVVAPVKKREGGAFLTPPAPSPTEAPMERVPLEASGLGVSPEEVSRLFAPFVLERHAPGDPVWDAEIARRSRKYRRRYWQRRLLGWLPRWQRRGDTVRSEYAKAWAKIDYAEYDPARTPPRPSPWTWRGERYSASDLGGTRVRQLLLVRLLERLRPRRVLEVGCGNGVNLMLLAGRFPETAFTGADLTREGPRAAARLQREPALPKAMQDYAPLPLADETAFRRVRFVQADASRLPFPDGAFDLVVTILALEQMERVREAALAEVARVAGRHTIMIEPFAELNDAGGRLHYAVSRDYFRGRIADLPRLGLRPALALDDFPQEAFLGACLVLAETRRAGA